MPVEWWRVNYRGPTEALLCSLEPRERMATIKYKKLQPTAPPRAKAGGSTAAADSGRGLTLPLTPAHSEAPHRATDRVALADLAWHDDSARSLRDVLHTDVSQWTLEEFFHHFPIETIRIPLPPEVVSYWRGRENECFAWIKKFGTDPHYLCYYADIQDDELQLVVNSATSSQINDFLVEGVSKLEQEIVKTIERKQRRWKLLEERGGTNGTGGDTGGESVEVFAHESVVGIVMGKQGENLSRVARSHKVEIRVYPDEDGVRRIRIYGQSPRQVYDACKELDYVYRSYQIPSQHLADRTEQIIKDGKGSSGAKELSQINGIHSVWIKRQPKPELFICGLRYSIAHYLKSLRKLLDQSPQAASFNVDDSAGSLVVSQTPAASARRHRNANWHHHHHHNAGASASRTERGAYETAV